MHHPHSVADPGCFIPDPTITPDPGGKKAPDPGSATLHISLSKLLRKMQTVDDIGIRGGGGNAGTKINKTIRHEQKYFLNVS
jgi:hypothetical protein